MTDVESQMRNLILEPLPLEEKYRLWRTWYVDAFVRGKKRTICIEPPFKTDGGSLPRMLWTTTTTPFAPKSIEGFVVHDEAYQRGGVYVMESVGRGRVKTFLPLNRKQADKLLNDFQKGDGVNAYITGKIYYGLRWFGWRAWNKYRKGAK